MAPWGALCVLSMLQEGHNVNAAAHAAGQKYLLCASSLLVQRSHLGGGGEGLGGGGLGGGGEGLQGVRQGGRGLIGAHGIVHELTERETGSPKCCRAVA